MHLFIVFDDENFTHLVIDDVLYFFVKRDKDKPFDGESYWTFHLYVQYYESGGQLAFDDYGNVLSCEVE